MKHLNTLIHNGSIRTYIKIFVPRVSILLNRGMSVFVGFQSWPCILSWLRVGRFIDRFSPIQKYAYHDIPCSRAILPSRSISLSLYEWPCIDYALLAHVFCILAKCAVITFVLIILSIHLIRRYVSDRQERRRRKNDRWVCDISWSPSRPRPTVLLNPKVFPPYPYPAHSPSFLFPFSPVPSRRRSRSRLSSRRILHPTDHGYESYLVASSTSPGSYEIAEASVVDASEY